MESAPTDLMVVLLFVCRGGYYPPAYYNPSVIFLRKCHLPLHKGGVYLVLTLLFGVIFMVVGATTMFSKKTCGLPSGRPRKTQ